MVSDFPPSKVRPSSEETSTFLRANSDFPKSLRADLFLLDAFCKEILSKCCSCCSVAVLEMLYHIPNFTSIFIYFIYKYRVNFCTCTIKFRTATLQQLQQIPVKKRCLFRFANYAVAYAVLLLLLWVKMQRTAKQSI